MKFGATIYYRVFDNSDTHLKKNNLMSVSKIQVLLNCCILGCQQRATESIARKSLGMLMALCVGDVRLLVLLMV